MKRFITLIFAFILISNITAYAGEKRENFLIRYGGNTYKYENKVVSINIDGNDINAGDMPALILDGRTLVPVREIFESPAFGAEVHWNAEKKQVYISYGDKLIVMQIGSDKASVNGIDYVLDVPPTLIRDMSKENAKTMIPLRFVSENLGFKVDWDSTSYTASLKSESYIAKNSNSPSTSEKKDNNDKTKTPESENSNQSNESISHNYGDDGDLDYVKSKDENKFDEKTVGKKLDGLDSKAASRQLPTGLKNSPVYFDAKYDVPNEKNILDFEAKTYETTVINNIKYHPETKSFVISATSEISSLGSFYLTEGGARFILDIENAVCDLDSEIPVKSSKIVELIRSSQFTKEPMNTRIVFDLNSDNAVFKVGLNEERNKVIVKLETNFIKNITLAQDEQGDYIDIKASTSPEINVFRLSSPDRIVLDIPNTTSLLDFMESSADGQYIKKIRTSQFSTDITRIVVEADGQPDYRIEKLGGGVSRIRFFAPNYGKLSYENIDKPTVKIESISDEISIDGIKYENDYLNKKFLITIPGLYADKFGEGSLKVNDGIIDEVSAKEVDGNTIISIKSAEIYEFRVENSDSGMHIKAYKPRDLYSQIVLIDPGHGGTEPGSFGVGIIEKNLNLNIALELKKLLDADQSIKAYYTRLDDSTVSLQERCDISNEINPDFFLSIHNNAFFKDYAHGTETWYFPTKTDDGFVPVNIAQILQDNMVAKLGSFDRGIKDGGELYVLRRTNNCAVLVELGFITNSDEAAKFKDQTYIEDGAKSLYDGILEVLSTYPTGR